MRRVACLFLAALDLLSSYRLFAGESTAVLPAGVKPVWSLEKAFRETTPTRERVCLNGLWRWQPGAQNTDSVPDTNWGYFKVPGCWPGITDYMQKDSQTLYSHSAWKETRLGEVKTAWYQREFTVPENWNGRRIFLSLEYLNSFATVWVDQKRIGDLRFPGGELEVTSACVPGKNQVLSISVVAMPLKGVMMSYGDTFGAKQVQGRVERRGLCGDVYLEATPAQERLLEFRVETSVRNWSISVDAAVDGLRSDTDYKLKARVYDGPKTAKLFESNPFKAADLKNGRIRFTADWKPEKLWDTHTPQNTYRAEVSLVTTGGKAVDTALPERLGFREFWIDGRDFYLNGSRIFLCAVPLDNTGIGAASATYAAARETLQRLKTFGINFVYTHNYGCEPGTHLSFAEILRAADDEGMLVSFSQPHFGQYDWKGADADQTNGYLHHAEFYTHAAGNHPAVICYSMSHNATGTEEEGNPDMIDGIHDDRNQWSRNGARLALRAEAIVKRLDPSRIVYHHSSGNLGSMHTANFYANFAPVQEMSDWLQHWATTGVKPLFLCEYGTPLSWDWMMYRGWYNGVREFGSARVPWELCLAEWNAQFFGPRAYQITDLEKNALRWEAKQMRGHQLWHRWDYPRGAVESPDLEMRNEILARYLAENIRAFRTWGISAWCPWDHGLYWKLRDGADHSRKILKVDWDSLQRPGFSPDYIEDQLAWMDKSFERADWIPTAAAKAIYRNNMPLLAYIAGKPEAFTSKDHQFNPGEKFQKQIIVINNSRTKVTAEATWSLDLRRSISGSKKVSIEAGQQVRLALDFAIPAHTSFGRYNLRAQIKFSNGETQEDSFQISVLPKTGAPTINSRIALFDPRGETAKLLKDLNVTVSTVDAASDLTGFDLLIIGKAALTPDSPAPSIKRVRDGLKVLFFEQTSEALEQRLGFRVEEYGLRHVFPRIPDHTALAGLHGDNLRDWRGEATILPAKLTYKIADRHAPEVKWCGLPVTRLWRAGNRGNVASVLIEKPPAGDFLPIADGGFALQFSPLLEYHEGRGMILFCQMDVTGRSETDPAATALAANLVRYVSEWKPVGQRQAIYLGNEAGREFLKAAGFSVSNYSGTPGPTNLLILSKGASSGVSSLHEVLSKFMQAGGHVVGIGLDQNELRSLPMQVSVEAREHISCSFLPPPLDSPFAGLNPADVYNRDPRELLLVTDPELAIGDGVLAAGHGGQIALCQAAPWEFAGNENNLRRTYRRISFAVTRLVVNAGASASTPLLDRFETPVNSGEPRYLKGLYLDQPQEWDDPYRFFCW